MKRSSTIFLQLVLVLIGIGGGILLAARGQKKPDPYEFITLEKNDIVQSVSVTGRVVPDERVDLGFVESGRITHIWKKVGEGASRGEVLAELDAEKIFAELAEAEASAKAEEVRLEELRRGARLQDVQVKEAEVAKAEQDTTNAYGKVLQTLEGAYAKSDDAARVKTLGLFNGGQTSGYWLNVSTCNSEAKSRSGELRGVAETALLEWRTKLAAITNSADKKYRDLLSEEMKEAKARLEIVRSLLEETARAINADCLLGEASLETYRKNVNTGRDAVLTAMSDMESLEREIETTKRALETKERELELKRAGASSEEVRTAELKIDEARARVLHIQARRNDMMLRAPFSGIVTEEKAKAGQIISANSPVLVFMSKGSPRIEVFVPEADIAKIRPGNSADITLDAYEAEEVFPAQVAKIDPAETLIDGVATYKVTLRFTKEDARVKPGMTADIDIVTGVRNAALAVPQRAVLSENGEKYARVLRDNGIERVRVVTGIRGSDGTIEVTEGLKEGDKVILFIDDTSAR